jgi:hypothetical protein
MEVGRDLAREDDLTLSGAGDGELLGESATVARQSCGGVGEACETCEGCDGRLMTFWALAGGLGEPLGLPH